MFESPFISTAASPQAEPVESDDAHREPVACDDKPVERAEDTYVRLVHEARSGASRFCGIAGQRLRAALIAGV